MTIECARPAATVLLVRGEAPFEIFFVKRHSKSGFMANAYVFPGGGVDEGDREPALRDRVDRGDPQRLCAQMAGIDTPPEALAHVVAAVREVFEESGALLARCRDGRFPDFAHGETASKFTEWRRAVNAGEVRFAEMIEAEDLSLAGDLLRYYAHWITPESERRRFDARFFLARLPAGQALVHDAKEVVDSCWHSPGQALAAYESGDFQLAPPTWRILRDLSAASGSGAVFNDVASSAPVTPIMPHLTREDGRLVLALPGDPLHPTHRGSLEDRIVLRDGRWSTC